jgi:hypothetical protein
VPGGLDRLWLPRDNKSDVASPGEPHDSSALVATTSTKRPRRPAAARRIAPGVHHGALVRNRRSAFQSTFGASTEGLTPPSRALVATVTRRDE